MNRDFKAKNPERLRADKLTAPPLAHTQASQAREKEKR
jgi:hypothetical protein